MWFSQCGKKLSKLFSTEYANSPFHTKNGQNELKLALYLLATRTKKLSKWLKIGSGSDRQIRKTVLQTRRNFPECSRIKLKLKTS